jgi:hypothetical protein
MDALLDRLLELWETFLSMLPDVLQSWSSPALEHMRLAPEGFEGNPLMVRISMADGFLSYTKAENVATRVHMGGSTRDFKLVATP